FLLLGWRGAREQIRGAEDAGNQHDTNETDDGDAIRWPRLDWRLRSRLLVLGKALQALENRLDLVQLGLFFVETPHVRPPSPVAHRVSSPTIWSATWRAAPSRAGSQHIRQAQDDASSLPPHLRPSRCIVSRRAWPCKPAASWIGAGDKYERPNAT